MQFQTAARVPWPFGRQEHSSPLTADFRPALSLAPANPYMRQPMARPKPATFDKVKTVADNRRARFDYFIEDTFEAGIALSGTEVKSLRGGEGSIAESYAEVRGNEAGWSTPTSPSSATATASTTSPSGRASCCSTQREIESMLGAVERKGMTLVPLSVYFNSRGRAKVELALAKGKQNHDKRATIKDRDWKRDKARLMRDRG